MESIARTVSAEHGSIYGSTRLFGLLNMALADGYIGSFATKYHYNFWRPVTAIQTADTDGNPNTSADPTWTPLVTTPPIPDYDRRTASKGSSLQGPQALLRYRPHRFETCSLTLPTGTPATT